MIRVDVRGVDQMQRELQQMSARGVPFAARDTVNGMAFEGRRLWGLEMQRALTLRNRYTQSRALVEKATTLRMSAMQARLGHPEEYMRQLEHGGRERAAKQFRPIPTEHAAGQAKGSLSGGRRRPVRRANVITTLGSLKAARRSGLGRRAQNAHAVRHALKSGKRLALLDLGKRKGIYRVEGSPKRARIRKLYDLTKRSTPVPKTPTLQPALAKVYVLAPGIAHRALAHQLERLGR